MSKYVRIKYNLHIYLVLTIIACDFVQASLMCCFNAKRSFDSAKCCQFNFPAHGVDTLAQIKYGKTTRL